MEGTAQASILHADLDAFYASVEQVRRPELRGKPIVVGGGVVLAASYEARRYGVRSAMPVGKARRMCPGLIVVDGEFERYGDVSKQVFEVCRRFTPLVEQISIDEAFLDVSGSTHLFGSPGEIASQLRAAVRSETGLALSIGVAVTKFLAKVGSQMAKPDGLVVIEPGTELDFLHPLPVSVIWGVGAVTGRKLADMGVETVGELAALPEEALSSRLGRGAGRHLHALAWNRDPRRVITRRRAGSVGAQSAFGNRVDDREGYGRVLTRLADRVGSRMRKKGRAGRTITLRMRIGSFGEYRSLTRSRTLRTPVSSTGVILRVASSLLDKELLAQPELELSLLGISVSNLEEVGPLQLELPLPGLDFLDSVLLAGTPAQLRSMELDRSIDRVREKFGKDSVAAASALLGRRDTPVPVAFADLLVADDEGLAQLAGSVADDEGLAQLAGSVADDGGVAVSEDRGRRRSVSP